MIPEGSPRWRRGRAAVILALAAALYLPSVWTRDPWNPDEPGYAEATRQMALGGDLLVPHFNGEVYSEKPPLFFWLSLPAGRIPGVPEGAGGRLVGVLASAGTLLLTWRIGALLMGEATGTLAAILLGSSLIFWHLAQSGVIDPLLALCTTAALYGHARHLRGLRPGMTLFYGACALGILAKGPVGLIVPGLAALTHGLLAAGPRALRSRHALWGIPLAVTPALAWLLMASARAGPEYLETMLLTQNLGRAVDAWVHRQPIWYYAATLPVVLLPLTLFVPAALAIAWKEKVCGVRPMLLPLCWFVSSFVFFTLLSSKKTRYMLVLAPAAALLAAGWLMRRYPDPGGGLRRGGPLLYVAALLCLALGACLGVFAAGGLSLLTAELREEILEPHSSEALAAIQAVTVWPGSLRLWIPAGILIATAAATLRLATRRRAEALAALLGGWILFLAVAGLAWVPVADPVKSARSMARLIERSEGTGTLYLLDDGHAPGLNFHLKRDRIPVLRGPGAKMRAAAEPGARFLGRLREMDRIERARGIRFVERACARVGSDVYCVASARPSPTPAAPPEADAPGAGS